MTNAALEVPTSTCPPILTADPGPIPCREGCGTLVDALQLFGGRYMVKEVCESCRLAAQRQDVAASRASSEETRVADAIAKLPRKFRRADLGLAGPTNEPPSPELAERHRGALVLPLALRPHARQLREWLPGAKGLLLHGPVGSGKTALVAGGFVHAHRRGLRGVWLSERSYLAALRDSASGRGDSAKSQSPAQLFSGADFVVLDEVGSTEAVTAWNRDRMEDLICQAYDDGIPVIATTNRPPGDTTTRAGLRHALGARAFDRLIETTIQLEIAAGSWRRA